MPERVLLVVPGEDKWEHEIQQTWPGRTAPPTIDVASMPDLSDMIRRFVYDCTSDAHKRIESCIVRFVRSREATVRWTESTLIPVWCAVYYPETEDDLRNARRLVPRKLGE